jgi:MoaA/NifB/PqqE/SkfB family radical SAM enzyme
MSPEIFEKIMPAIEKAEDVSLDGQGEFFLAKNRFSIFSRMRDMGKNTVITTNGALINDEILDRIIFDGLTCLNFSIDGVTAAKHERLRTGSDHTKLIETIRKISDRKRANGLTLPHIGLNFVARRDNIEELPAIAELAAELGVKDLQVAHLWLFDKSMEQESLYHHQELSDRCFRETLDRNRGKSLNIFLPEFFSEASKHGSKKFRKCTFPWDVAFISAPGEIFACCDPRLVMGSLQKDSFEKIWNGKPYKRLRKTINSPKVCEVCASCSMPNTQNPSNPRCMFMWLAPNVPASAISYSMEK